MPLLRLDMGAVFGSHVGDSEHNIRETIKIADSVSPCVLWVDEIEKGISGVGSSNNTDGGVTARVFGTFVSWMAEKTKPVFVVATANNIDSIPPEFLRAGRFDEIFFLDLPDEGQREDVIEKLIRKKNRDASVIDVQSIVRVTKNYSPAEIEKGIDNALFVAYADGRREMTTSDIVSEMGRFQPLYNGRREDVERMRRQALGENGSGGLARLANSTKKVVQRDPQAQARNINLDHTTDI